MDDSSRGRTPPSQVVILIAEGVEVSPVSYCVEKLRDAGINVALLSLADTLVRGKNGLALSADGIIEMGQQIAEKGIVLIPGRQACVKKLLIDPRVHALIDRIWATEGVVAVLESAEATLQTILATDQIYPRLWQQNNRTFECFIDNIIRFITKETSIAIPQI